MNQTVTAGYSPELREWALVLAREEDVDAAFAAGRVEVLELPSYGMAVEVTTDAGCISAINAVFFRGPADDDYSVSESSDTVSLVVGSTDDGETSEPIRGLCVTRCRQLGTVTRVEISGLGYE